MNKALATMMESTPPTQAKTKITRNRRRRGAKSKAAIESESSDSTEEHTSKAVARQGLKSSLKARPQSSEKDLKTIVTDSSLLMPEIVASGQTEHDEHHQAKLSGVRDIIQADVSSSPDATMNFWAEKIRTQLTEYIQNKLTEIDTPSSTESSKTNTSSALQVLKDLKY